MVRKYRVTLAGHSYEVEVEELGPQGVAVRSAGRVLAATPAATAAPAAPAAQAAPAASAKAATACGTICSPLPGKVLAVRAQVGQKVKRGDLLMVIEAMKMENEIFAGQAGTVRKVLVVAGQNVETGDPLAELTPAD